MDSRYLRAGRALELTTPGSRDRCGRCAHPPASLPTPW